MRFQRVRGEREGHRIWQKCMPVFVEMLLVWKKGSWAQILLSAVGSRAVKLHGYVVHMNIHSINIFFLYLVSFRMLKLRMCAERLAV